MAGTVRNEQPNNRITIEQAKAIVDAINPGLPDEEDDEWSSEYEYEEVWTMAGTLAVRNEAQKVLFDEELAGQISDGMWENARPFDHWEPWARAEVVVDPSNVGRDFWARKDNYRLDDKELLDIVGERMVVAVIRHTNRPYDMKALRADLRDLRAILKTRRS